MGRQQLFAANYNKGVMGVYKALGKWLDERGIDFLMAECDTEEEVIEQAQAADIYLAFQFPVTRRIIASLPQLKLLMSSGSGYDHIDVAAATEHGVIVTNTTLYNVEDVAEHALTLILTCGRKVGLSQQLARQGHWQVGGLLQPTHRFAGQMVGLIGFGHIGQSLAWRLRALGFKVVAYDPYVPPQAIQECGVEPMKLKPLLRESDFVSLHLRMSEETRHLIGFSELQLMKPPAFLINTSRGGVIDEAALIAALQAGEIAGAALDVLEQEPPDPGNPLLDMENVIVTGHCAGSSVEGIMDWQNEWRMIIEAFLSGKFPINVVNPAVFPRVRLSRI